MHLALSIAAIYHFVISIVTFITYALDKRAARRGHLTNPPARRIRERTLHILEVLGGWPGALLAQRLLRHKTVDTSFRRVFFLAVAGHLLSLALLIFLFVRFRG